MDRQSQPLESLVFQHAEQVAKDCASYADELARKGRRKSMSIKALRALLGLIGILAIVATYVPAVSAIVGPDAEQKISLGAALALIISAIGPVLFSSDPPERFYDYAHYIRSYKSKITHVITHHQLTDDQKQDTLMELTNIARANLDDVRNKWPDIATRAAVQLSDSARG